MNILLFGFVGSGKSSIGKKIAKNLNMHFVELDELVLEHSGYKTIEEIYKKRPSLWKELELQVSKDMSVEDNLVIACGGGFIENELNIQYFKERPNKVVCVYLSAEVDTLAFRSYEKIKMKNSKVPLDQIRTSIEKIYAKRDLLYRTYSDIVINTDFTEVYKAANDLTELVKKQEAILSIQ